MASKIFTKTLMIFSTLDNGGYLNFSFYFILFYLEEGPLMEIPLSTNRESGVIFLWLYLINKN